MTDDALPEQRALTPDECDLIARLLEGWLTGALSAPPGFPIVDGQRPLLESAYHKLVDALERAYSAPALELAAALVAARAALEYYADHAQYEPIERGEAADGGCKPGDPRILKDRGARARRALRPGGA